MKRAYGTLWSRSEPGPASEQLRRRQRHRLSAGAGVEAHVPQCTIAPRRAAADIIGLYATTGLGAAAANPP